MPLAVAARKSGRRGAPGFSIIEAVVAAAILMLATTGVSGVVTASLRAERAEAVQQQLEQRVQAELARLSALPYVLPEAAPGPEGMDPVQARSLLGAVFPHALVMHNTATASFVPGSSGDGGTFTTVRAEAWGSMRVTGRFVSAGDAAWSPAPATCIEGWAVWLEATPPSPAVQVTVEASSSGPRPHRAEASAILDALRPCVAEPAP